MNRKLSLDVDALAVTSFPTDDVKGIRGTVPAHVAGPACPWSQPLSCKATQHTCASFDVTCAI